MHQTRVLLLALIVFGSAAIAAQNPATLAKAWESTTDQFTSPDAAFAFGSFNTFPGRFDRNADGRVDLIVADRNGDGRGDYWATDRNFDGFIDDYQYDRNLDGRIDQWEYDFDYDGVSDKIFVDSRGSGSPDMYADLNPMNRTYTWYGNMAGGKLASGKMGFPNLKGSKRVSGGRAAYSL